jgi:hypothetical protein
MLTTDIFTVNGIISFCGGGAVLQTDLSGWGLIILQSTYTVLGVYLFPLFYIYNVTPLD